MPSAADSRIRALLRDGEGQATVEAAMLLPVMMLCLALLVQPACVLYTRGVMYAAAAEACRLMATPPTSSFVAESSRREYVLRRLGAVPNVDIFHVGGEAGWTIELVGEAGGHVTGAYIATWVRPLPFIGVVASLLGPRDAAGNVLIEVTVGQTVRPSWVEGTYASWTNIWD